MPTQSAWVINNEILECAKHCLNAEDSRAAANDCIQQLQARGWERKDIEEVVRGAFSVLAHLNSLEMPKDDGQN